MPAVATAPTTPETDRFPGPADVPDPPKSPKGRLRYWNDTVQEAVAELRRQLRSHDPDRADRALFAILDLEKTRLRHGRAISGTSVPCLSDIDDDWGNPIATKEAATPPSAPAEASPGPTANADAVAEEPLPPPTAEEQAAQEEERAVERYMAAIMTRIERPRYANWDSLPPRPKCFAHLAGWPQPSPSPRRWPDDPPGFRDDQIGPGRPAIRPPPEPPK